MAQLRFDVKMPASTENKLEKSLQKILPKLSDVPYFIEVTKQ